MPHTQHAGRFRSAGASLADDAGQAGIDDRRRPTRLADEQRAQILYPIRSDPILIQV
jgi:hypothetical protein